MNSVYHQQIAQQGKEPSRVPAPKVVPAHLQDRYDTWEQYEDAMADFLNGN